MKFIGFEREEEANTWLKKQLGLNVETGFYRAMSAVHDDGSFGCVVVFSNFTARNIDINIAIDRLTPRVFVEFFNAVFSYTFTQLKAARVTALIRGSNSAAQQFAARLGFKAEGVLRKAFSDDDLHVYGFLAEEYNTHAWRRG